jgi:hypothetical protein
MNTKEELTTAKEGYIELVKNVSHRGPTMKKHAFTALVLLLFTGFLAGPSLSQDAYQDPYMMQRGDSITTPGESVLFDLIFLRPAGIIACAVGIVGSVAATPFVMSSGEAGVYKGLVADPFAYTFKRPLGRSGPSRGRTLDSPKAGN